MTYEQEMDRIRRMRPKRDRSRKLVPGAYDREGILARIIELRSTGTPYDTIAETLNSEGFKPMTASQFCTSTIYQLHMNAIKTRQVA